MTNPRPTLIVLIVLTVLLASATVSGESEVTIITYYSAMNNVQSEAFQEYIVRPFEDAHPHIKIEHINPATLGANSTDHFYVLYASGQAPDISAWGYSYVPAFIDQGMIRPVEDLLHDVDLDAYMPSAIHSFMFEGRLYGLPVGVGSILAFYNSDMFDRAGIELPSADWQDTWTWDEVVLVGSALTRDIDGDGVPEQWTIANTQTHWLWPWFFGGDWVSPDGNEAIIHRPEGVQGLQLWQDLIYEHGILPGPAAWGEQGRWGYGESLWFGGQAGMILDGNWAAGNFVERIGNNFNWVTRPLPRGSRPATVIFADALLVSQASENLDAVATFLNWYAGEEASLARIEHLGMVIADRTYAHHLEERLSAGIPQMDARVLLQAFDYGVPRIRTVPFAEVEGVVNGLIDDLLHNRISAQGLATQMQAQMNAILREYQ